MQKPIRIALLVLLLLPFAWAAPAWRVFAPAKEKFQCQLPAGEVTDSDIPEAHQWMLIAKGKYVFQIGYARAPGTPANTSVFISSMMKSAHIAETGRKKVTENGLSGTEVSGVMEAQKGLKMPARLRIFPLKDRIYTLNAIILNPADKALADKFFESFKLK